MGFYYAMMALDFERIQLGCTGMLQRLLEELKTFVRRTKRDGRRLGAIPWVRRALADLEMRVEVGRQIGLLNAWLIDQGQVPTKEGSISKIYVTELNAHFAADRPRHPRSRRPAGPDRPGVAAARSPAVALHHRSDAALRRRHQRDPAHHHRRPRPRPATEVAMHLAPTDEQQAIIAGARRFLGTEITRERRLAWDQSMEGHDPRFWQAVAELGWFGYGLSEAVGGQGASLLDVALLVEECGRAVAPLGVFAAIAGGLVLDALGDPGAAQAMAARRRSRREAGDARRCRGGGTDQPGGVRDRASSAAGRSFAWTARSTSCCRA